MTLNLDFKGLSEPATKLIEAVSKGIGTLYEPTRIVKEARAKSEAALILAQADIQKQELIQRAINRLAFVETRRQQVVEAIIENALAELPQNVSRDPVSDDWMAQFFANCQDIGEEEMQALWGKILAGETAKPGSYSRRTLDTLKLMDREDARAFGDFCSFVFKLRAGGYLYLESGAAEVRLQQVYGGADIKGHLIDIGLLGAENHIVGVSHLGGWHLEYFGSKIRFSAPGAPPSPMIEQVVVTRSFTAVGHELLRVASAAPTTGFLEALSQELALLRVELLMDQE